MNSVVKNVVLKDFNIFEVVGENFSNFYINFFVDGKKISISKISENHNNIVYKINDNIEVIGHFCYIETSDGNKFDLDDSTSIDFHGFDDIYNYEGKLGALYNKEYTEFVLFAPLVKKAYVFINDNYYEMKRENKGIYRLTINGDFDGALYQYKILINNKWLMVNDPYGVSGNANNIFSAVINLEKLNFDTCDNYLPKLNSYLDAIIYEANVRDISIDENTNIIHKGKFLGLYENDVKTSNGNKAGIEYISSLGISHLQLLPVLNIATIDDNNPDKTYNWGYDPENYFTLEGSYSTSPSDPYSRMIEFKNLVKAYHQRGIRINLDVVYNHVYEAKTSTLNKITPNYYFRRDKNNVFLNHSYCGNELASERIMVRKLILDSLLFLLNTYHVDGFRFDLMGLIDIDTMKIVDKKLRQLKPDIMLYGEGWNMFTTTSNKSKLCTLENASEFPNIAFFNDRYRNIVRGSGSKAFLDENGYFLGNKEYVDGFKFAYLGSSFDITFPKLFNNINQSINYVECHDNATIYDVVNNSLENEDVLRIVKKINKLLMFSFGIPFIHAGQEIGLSKFNHHNSYNEGDKYNKFDYALLDKRIDMVASFISYIKARKEIKLFSSDDMNLLDNNIHIESIERLVHIVLNDLDNSVYHIYINPSSNGYHIGFDKTLEFFIPKEYKKDKISQKMNYFDISPQQVSIFKECK